MKKIFIFISCFILLLGSSSFGLGINCWEEYGGTATPPTSNLATALTDAGGTVILKSTMYNLFAFFNGRDYVYWVSGNAVAAVNNPPSIANLKITPALIGAKTTTDSYDYVSSLKTFNYSKSSSSSNATTQASTSLLGTILGYTSGSSNASYTHTYSRTTGYYVYTYCLISEGSSGGGGGVSTAAVNYIIKAD